MQTRLEKMPDAARIRRQTAEHVFGTLKSWMGATHFLMKRRPRGGTADPGDQGRKLRWPLKIRFTAAA